MPLLAAFGALLASAAPTRSDSVKPFHFGPFLLNQISLSGNPAGMRDILPFGYYHFEVGWIEPIQEKTRGFLRETYFETNGNFKVSPFQSDLGTTFNLKPVRYFEFGLSYNRLMYHNAMVSFTQDSVEWLPPEKYPPDLIVDGARHEPGGGDVFTFQGNFTLDLMRLQLHAFGTRALWDIDAKGRDFIWEYESGLLIRPRDRINTALFQVVWDLTPHSRSNDYSYTGLCLRSKSWWTDRTLREQTLISAGLTGFRIGRNPKRQKRGLDVNLGYWLQHEQLNASDSWMRRIQVVADWRWNIQVLAL